jgi:diaminopimelate decarboxylase
VLSIAHREGLCCDVASAGELEAALRAGFPGTGTWFHGNNKSPAEIARALDVGSRLIVDIWQELANLEAEVERRRANGSEFAAPEIMVRITPGIEAHTHEYIKTGQYDTKFGFPDGEVSKGALF